MAPIKYNRNGMTLVEVLITLSIVSIITASFLTLMTSAQKEARDLADKYEMLDLEKLLATVMADGSVCTKILAKNSPPKKFDPTEKDPKVVIDSIPMSASDDPKTPDLIRAGERYSNNIFIKNIELKNFKSTGSNNEFYASFLVNVDENKLVRSFKPLSFKTIIRTQDTIDNKKEITSCALTLLTRMERVFFHYSETPQPPINNIHYCSPECDWKVPLDAKGSAFVTIAGGGASALGPLVLNSAQGGSSGGYLMNAPVNITPGATVKIIVGAGGKVKDDSTYIVGSPGKLSKFGDLLQCSGGGTYTQCYGDSPAYTSLYAFGNPGMHKGIDSGYTCFPSTPKKIGSPGEGDTNIGEPGKCGNNNYGIGNPGSITYQNPTVSSGLYSGGRTPLGYGSGGDDVAWGARVMSDGKQAPEIGNSYPPCQDANCSYNPATADAIHSYQIMVKIPNDGREGVVIVDYMR